MIYRALNRVKRNILNRRVSKQQVGCSEDLSEEASELGYLLESFARTRKLLGRWNEELRRVNIGFSVVVLGDYTVSWAQEFVDGLRADFEPLGASVVAIRTAEEDLVKYQSFDGVTIGHYNRAGHAWVADRLVDWMQERLGQTTEVKR